MKFDVATNLDMELLNYIKEKDVDHEIASLYGKLKYDLIGGGRPSTMVPEYDMEYLKKYIKRCKEMNIKFNYLLNPLCLDCKDMIPEEHNKIINFLKELRDIGVTAVTVNSPYLCEIIKKQFPEIKVTIGIYAMVNTFMRIKYWVELGADEITIGHRMTRDFDMLKKILLYLKDKNVSIRVIANNGCLHSCPFEANHGATVSHVSGSSEVSKYYIDYSLINCYYRKISNISNLVSVDWIRPEDIAVYEKICKESGNDNLIIKLVERTKTTKYMKNVISAYLDRKYDGNLSDLLNWPEELVEPVDPKGFFDKIADGEMSLSLTQYYFNMFDVPIPYIDNKKLNGFIDHFVNNNTCLEKICWCGEEISENEKGQYCKYCYEWAKKVVSFPDEKKREKWIKNTKYLREEMAFSKMYEGKK